MKKKFIFLFFLGMLCGCSSTRMVNKVEDQAIIKQMTTKQYNVGYDLVYSSVMSLLQSDGFLISNTDKEAGLINAYKQVDNRGADISMLLIGYAKKAETAQMAILVDKINPTLTEVKVTISQGKITSENLSSGGNGVNTRETNSMIRDASVYAEWFNNLRAEIARRKALR